MNEDLVKAGSVSIVVGQNHYGKYITPKKGKLLKITYLDSIQNEFQHMDVISKIPQAQKYFALTENSIFRLDEKPEFLEKIKEIIINEEMENMISKTLIGFFVDYGGDKEIYDTVVEMIENYKSEVWKKTQDILNFIRHVIEGLDYLHQEKICHLDVKLENIMMDTKTKNCKLIDFGFASIEPFTQYIKKPRGTPGYFPQRIAGEKITIYHPQIKANDLIYDMYGSIPIRKNPQLVYKIDSYCLGRTLYCLWIAFQEIQPTCCFCHTHVSKTKNGKIIGKIIRYLLDNDIYQRKTISEIRSEFFKEDKIKITPV